MGRNKTPLAERIAKFVERTPDEIQWIFDHPATSSGEGECMRWLGSLSRSTPQILEGGRPRPVRRLMVEACNGEPLPAHIRVEPGCHTMFCVHPYHSRLRQLATVMPLELADDDPIEDVASYVYTRPEPWDAEQIAALSGYSLVKVREAIAGIQAGTL